MYQQFSVLIVKLSKNQLFLEPSAKPSVNINIIKYNSNYQQKSIIFRNQQF